MRLSASMLVQNTVFCFETLMKIGKHVLHESQHQNAMNKVTKKKKFNSMAEKNKREQMP